MDEVWIVFLAGSSISFALMMYVYYRVFLKHTAKEPAPRSAIGVGAANRGFLDFLRAEAVSRVNDNLASVMAHQSKAASENRQRGLERATAARLVESRQTLQSLFSSEVVAAYDKVVAALDGRSVSPPEATRLVSEFKVRLTGYLENKSSAKGKSAAFG